VWRPVLLVKVGGSRRGHRTHQRKVATDTLLATHICVEGCTLCGGGSFISIIRYSVGIVHSEYRYSEASHLFEGCTSVSFAALSAVFQLSPRSTQHSCVAHPGALPAVLIRWIFRSHVSIVHDNLPCCCDTWELPTSSPPSRVCSICSYLYF
jgi:hypothetical protein